MNPFQRVNQRVMQDAEARVPDIEKAIAEARMSRIKEQQAEYAARQPGTMAAQVAKHLNAGGRDSDDYSDSGLYTGYDLLRSMFSGAASDPATVKQEQLLSAVQGLNTAQKGAVGRVLADAQGPGMVERMRGMEAGINRTLADPGMKGQAARLGLFTGIGGGTVAVLTPAGQGLMALMDYMQQTQVAAAERDNELT